MDTMEIITILPVLIINILTIMTGMKVMEKEQAEISAQLENGQLYATDPAKATQLASRHAEVEAQWLLAMERLDELSPSAS